MLQDVKDDHRETRKLAVLLIDGFALMSYASIIEPFRAANILSQKKLYEWVHVSVRDDVIRASNGASILAEARVGTDLKVDTIFVIAGGNPASFTDSATFAWLRHLARAGIRIAGVSGGPYLLARAGILESYRCTIHWDHVPVFLEAFPTHLLESKLYVIDRKRMTCAGGTAGLDLAIDIVERDHGHELAVDVSDWFIRTQPRPSDEQQRMSLRERYNVSNEKILRVLAQMEAHIEDPLAREDLASGVGISVRQLERLFKSHLGSTTADMYRTIRLTHANALLRKTGMSVTEVAVACGFVSSSHFSRAYKAQYGQAPKFRL